jgi:hypothetical protein
MAIAVGPVGPRRARRQGRRRQRNRDVDKVRALRGRTFPVYGLDHRWQGRRWVGGWGSSGDVVIRIDLAHGDAWDDASPLVRVEAVAAPTGDGSAGRAGAALHVAMTAQQLAQHLFRESGEYSDEIRESFRSADPTGSWQEMTLDLDGHPTSFRSLTAGSSWVALRQGSGGLVAIRARHIDPTEVHLVTVEDVEPYLTDDGDRR